MKRLVIHSTLLGVFALSACHRDCSPKAITTFLTPTNVCLGAYACRLSAISVVGPDLYWSVASGNGDGACIGGLYTARKVGGPSAKLADGCVLAIASDSENLYWADASAVVFPPQAAGRGSLWSRPLSGGTNIQIADAPDVLGASVGPKGLYSIEIVGGTQGDRGIVEHSLQDGGSRLLLQTNFHQADFPGPIIADSTSVYWTESAYPADGGTEGRVLRLALAGGGPLVLASVPRADLFAMVLSGGSLYWIEDVSWNVWKTDLLDGTSTQLSPAGGNALGLAADDKYVYWTSIPDNGHDAVMRTPIDGGVSTALARLNRLAPPVAVDGDRIYFGDTVPSGVAGQQIQTIYSACKDGP